MILLSFILIQSFNSFYGGDYTIKNKSFFAKAYIGSYIGDLDLTTGKIIRIDSLDLGTTGIFKLQLSLNDRYIIVVGENNNIYTIQIRGADNYRVVDSIVDINGGYSNILPLYDSTFFITSSNNGKITKWTSNALKSKLQSKFSVNIREGIKPATIQFYDDSYGYPASWLWDLTRKASRA